MKHPADIKDMIVDSPHTSIKSSAKFQDQAPFTAHYWVIRRSNTIATPILGDLLGPYTTSIIVF